MTYVCLWSPGWSTGGASFAERAAGLLELAPRVVVEARGVIWADARGLPAERLAGALLARLGPDAGARAGVAAVAVAAEVAARGGTGPVTLVEPGGEREFLGARPLAELQPDEKLEALLYGVGVQTCGELAALPRESVEVRFGGEAVLLWRLARADDPRRLFRPIEPEQPQSAIDFLDYAVRDARRLLFTANACLTGLCEMLRQRGERARLLELELSLSDGSAVRRELRIARPTAERAPWMRRLQRELERLTLHDTVAGVALRVVQIDAAAAVQGDLFDVGFATAGAAEDALARLLDAHGAVLVEPEVDAHPLAERRTRWRELDRIVADEPAPGAAAAGPRLALQLLTEPHRLNVRARPRQEHLLPTAYLDTAEDAEWHTLVTAAGPDRVSGGHWEDEPFAREYYRCVDDRGLLLWLFRDARENSWYLHGWWD